MLRAALMVCATLAFAVLLFPTTYAQAQLTCYFSSSPECRFLAVCRKLPLPPNSSSNYCACVWQLHKTVFPENQLPVVAEVYEALNDKTAMELVTAKLGANIWEFIDRMNRLDSVAKAKCH